MRQVESQDALHAIDTKSDELCSALQSSSIPAAIALIEELITQYGHYKPVKQILFKRNCRPQSIPHLIVLLRYLARSPWVKPSHRIYSQVALGYQALNLEDKELAQEIIEPLTSIRDALAGNSATFQCQRENRMNKFKRFVSLNTCLYQLHLLFGNYLEVRAIGTICHDVLVRVSFDRLPADVTYRAMSNLARSICLQPSLELVKQDLDTLILEARRPCHCNSSASENHLEFLKCLLIHAERRSFERLSDLLDRVKTSPLLRANLIFYLNGEAVD